MPKYLLAIDQGTTSSRAFIISEQASCISYHQISSQQYFPQEGWVEHNPNEIWQATLSCCRNAIEKAGLTYADISAIGIANQRETTLVWDKSTGEPIYPAIVWQDRRTAPLCNALKNAGDEKEIQSKTGLLLDPYFSATKIAWLLEKIPHARSRAEKGELAFGTMDSFLLWHLTSGLRHTTDITNASRTLLFNIHTLQWDDDLLRLFKIPKAMLPSVEGNCTHFGSTDPHLFGGEIPIMAMVGDQQAAMIGQACFSPGMAKVTYGTGAFLMLNTGIEPTLSQNRLLTTIAYQYQNKTTYALEGSIFAAGSIIQWLRDQLGIIQNAAESEELAIRAQNNGGIHFMPALAGLGAPYWNTQVRGAILGLTHKSDRSHIVRAALEAVAYQTHDLVKAMHNDSALHFSEMRVDGGMSGNNWLMQFLSDILQIPVERSFFIETTALGAAFLAGLSIGVFSSLQKIEQLFCCDKRFEPMISSSASNDLYNAWEKAVAGIMEKSQH